MTEDVTNNGTTENQPWFNSYQGEDRGYIESKGWHKEDGIQKMFESYKGLEALKGVPADKLIRIPEEGGSWEDVYKRLGKPETIEGYDFKPDESMKLDEDRSKWFTKTAYELNLTKSQHADLVKRAYEYETNTMKAREEASLQESQIMLDSLKKDWGDKFEERLELSKRAYRAFVKDDAALDKLESIIGDAQIIKFMANIGEGMGEHSLPKAERTESFGYSKEQGQNDLKQLMADVKADPVRLTTYNQGKGKDYENYNRLMKVVYGQAGA